MITLTPYRKFLLALLAFTVAAWIAVTVYLIAHPIASCPPADRMCELGMSAMGNIIWSTICTAYVAVPLWATVIVSSFIVKFIMNIRNNNNSAI